MTTYLATSTSTTPGVESDSAFATVAVKAVNTAGVAIFASSSTTDGIQAASASGGHSAVWGNNSAGGFGVAGSTSSATASGITGSNTSSSTSAVGASGTSTNGIGVSGSGPTGGVSGTSNAGYGVSGSGPTGVSGISTAAFGTGVYGECDLIGGNGVFGFTNNGNNYAILGKNTASGGVGVNCVGLLAKSGGTFLIDHPLDPTNKYLAHSFVESPDMKNVYDGVETADANGEFTVTMPTYFEALNQDFRYQLTALGGPAPDLHVKQELKTGTFVVGGAKKGMRVCWQITGIRRDPWAIANPVIVERSKRADEIGFYRHPEVYGEPETKGIHRRRTAPLPPQHSTRSTP